MYILKLYHKILSAVYSWWEIALSKTSHPKKDILRFLVSRVCVACEWSTILIGLLYHYTIKYCLKLIIVIIVLKYLLKHMKSIEINAHTISYIIMYSVKCMVDSKRDKYLNEAVFGLFWGCGFTSFTLRAITNIELIRAIHLMDVVWKFRRNWTNGSNVGARKPIRKPNKKQMGQAENGVFRAVKNVNRSIPVIWKL